MHTEKDSDAQSQKRTRDSRVIASSMKWRPRDDNRRWGQVSSLWLDPLLSKALFPITFIPLGLLLTSLRESNPKMIAAIVEIITRGTEK